MYNFYVQHECVIWNLINAISPGHTMRINYVLVLDPPLGFHPLKFGSPNCRNLGDKKECCQD